MKLHHHFVPHSHEVGHHRAHLISPKSLFVYFNLLLVFLAFIYFLRFGQPQILGAVTFSAGEIIALTNAERQKAGLETLVENEKLTTAAISKANDMFEGDYWAHYSPTGKSPWVFITGAGYKYIYAGENLARDFDEAKSVVSAWMRSPTHRANLLDSNFKEIGVAVSDGKIGGRDGILVVQMFGSSVFAPVGAQSGDLSASSAQETSVQGEQAVEQVRLGKGAFLTSQYNLAKSVSLALISFVFLLFVVEAVVSASSSHLKFQPQVVAHLVILGLAILALWYSASGAIL